MNKEKCLCEPTEILIFPCSGGSNVGQISNEVAKDLTTLDHGALSMDVTNPRLAGVQFSIYMALFNVGEVGIGNGMAEFY